jgi:hypothetical protein
VSDSVVHCPKCSGPLLPARERPSDSPRPFCHVCRRYAVRRASPPREAKAPAVTTDDRTELEAAFDHWWHLLADPALPRPCKWIFEPGRKFEVDRGFPDQSVGVELEGIDHRKEDRYHRDIEKYNLASERGIILLRYATRTLERDPAACIAQIERVLRERIKI